MKFKELNIGENFKFEEPSDFSKESVYQKTGSRKYRRIEIGRHGYLSDPYTIGTVNVKVVKI